MLIRFFIESTDKEIAIRLVNKGLYDAQEYIKGKKIKNVMPYWKEKNIFIVEADLEINSNLMQDFLSVFSDNWMEIGYPVDELLASRNNKNCVYMKEGFILINIFLNV